MERLFILINKGEKIINNRFAPDYKGNRNVICIQDLIHKSSSSLVDDLLNTNNGSYRELDSKPIAILQNIETEEDTDEKQLDVGMLILKDKLVYYHTDVFTGNWKSGNCIMLVCNSSMGFLIKNKFLTSKSSVLLSTIDSFYVEFYGMYQDYINKEIISSGTWERQMRNINKVMCEFQNISTVFKYLSNDAELKEELFSIKQVFKDLYELFSISSFSNEFSIEMQFEEGIPDIVYGDMTKFKQIITNLLNFTHFGSNQELKITSYTRLVDIDAQRRYNIEIKIGIPQTGKISASTLYDILTNKILDLNFFIRRKDEINKYEFGIMVCGNLISQLEGNINVVEKENNIHIILRIPFNPNSPQGACIFQNKFINNPIKEGPKSFVESAPNEEVLNPSKDVFNLTRIGVSPMSGNAVRYNEASQKSSSKQEDKNDEFSSRSRHHTKKLKSK